MIKSRLLQYSLAKKDPLKVLQLQLEDKILSEVRTHAPVKGRDYFTNEEINQIIQVIYSNPSSSSIY